MRQLVVKMAVKCQNIGETNFQSREFLRSGSKAKDGKEREKERKRERPKVGNNHGQLRIAKPPRVAYAKPPGPVFTLKSSR